MLDSITNFLIAFNDGSVAFINGLDTVGALMFGGSLGYILHRLVGFVKDTLGWN